MIFLYRINVFKKLCFGKKNVLILHVYSNFIYLKMTLLDFESKFDSKNFFIFSQKLKKAFVIKSVERRIL